MEPEREPARTTSTTMPSLDCPGCNALIDASVASCPYCGTLILSGDVGRGAQGGPESQSASAVPEAAATAAQTTGWTSMPRRARWAMGIVFVQMGMTAITAAVRVTASLVLPAPPPDQGAPLGPPGLVLMGLFVLGIYAVLAHQLYRGRGGSRTVYVLLTVAKPVLWLRDGLIGAPPPPSAELAVQIVYWALGIVACVLFYTGASKEYFTRARRR